MAKCSVCGKSVICANVMHGSCWEKKVQQAAERFCDDYCIFAAAQLPTEELVKRCEVCPVVELAGMSREVEPRRSRKGGRR